MLSDIFVSLCIIKMLRRLLHITLLVLWIFTACTTSSDDFKITGEVRFAGSAENFVEIKPIHYKYAPKIRHSFEFQEDGKFSVAIPLSREQIVTMHIGNESYPLWAAKGERAHLEIDMRSFPQDVKLTGFGNEINQKYQNFIKEDLKLREGRSEHRADFVAGKNSDYLGVQKLRKDLAKQHFGDTEFQDIMYRVNGEYLVSALEYITHKKENGEHKFADRKRQEILQKAHDLHFFSYESLKAQRAGIRDFTNAFANTFGIQQKYEKKYNQDLTTNDIRQLAYAELDSVRTLVLDYIYDPHALAHAKMYLVAERLGEAPFDFAEQTYFDYMQQFAGFPELTSFLRFHYETIKRVQPREPAIDVTYPDANEELITLSSLEGNYVLLKYWATWCANCRYQEPYLKELYDVYSDFNFEIYSISIDAEKQDWLDEMTHDPKPWVNVYAGNEFTEESFLAYRAGSIPHYVLIDPDGKILRNNDFRPSFNLPDILEDIFEVDLLGSR